MREAIDFLLTVFHDDVVLYSGYFSLYLAAVIYLYVANIKGKIIDWLMWFGLAAILLFCFPPFLQISLALFIDSEMYFSMLWLLPVLPIMGFVFVDYLGRLKKWTEKCIWIIFCVTAIHFAGSCVYLQTDWYEDGYSSMNPYLEEQLEICGIAHAYDSKALLAVPGEMLPVVRQLTGELKLIYGQDIHEGHYSEEIVSLYELLEAEEVNMKGILDKAKPLGVTYLILDSDWETREISKETVDWGKYIENIYETKHYKLLAI